MTTYWATGRAGRPDQAFCGDTRSHYASHYLFEWISIQRANNTVARARNEYDIRIEKYTKTMKMRIKKSFEIWMEFSFCIWAFGACCLVSNGIGFDCEWEEWRSHGKATKCGKSSIRWSKKRKNFWIFFRRCQRTFQAVYLDLIESNLQSFCNDFNLK